MPVYVCIIKAVHWISYLCQDKVSPVHGSLGLASLHCIGVGIGSVEEFSRGLGISQSKVGRQAGLGHNCADRRIYSVIDGAGFFLGFHLYNS